MLYSLFNSAMGLSLSYQSAVETISEWRAKPAKELIFDSSHREIRKYLAAADKIYQSPNARDSDELFAEAKARLEREFQAVLSRISGHAVGPSSVTEWSSILDSSVCSIRFGDYAAYEAPNEQVILYLKTIAQSMNTWGNLDACVRVYKNVRKNLLQSQLNNLHFHELNSGENNRRVVWDELKVKLEVWVPVSKICVQIFFEREKKLCEEIFAKTTAAAMDECFVGTVNEFAVKLFSFVKRVSLDKHSYERMAPVLALYDAFSKVLEDNATLFGSEAGASTRNFCSETLCHVEDDVRRMLYDFENAVANDSSDPGDKGAVIRLTEYAMDQIILLGRNEKLLKNLIKSAPLTNFGSVVVSEHELGDVNFQTFLDRHIVLIFVVLLKNLEGKSKRCKDPVLADLFVMNNVHFIVQKVEASNELQTMIGDFFLGKLRDKVQAAMTSYGTTTSKKFLTCFRDEGLYISRCWLGLRLSKSTLKMRMDAFNKVYTETLASHSRWTIPDSLLRNKVRSFLSDLLIPEYERFLEKFREGVKSSKCNSIKHSAKDLKALLSEKMFGNS